MAKHYHLIGIGGIGMSGIAQLLLSRGFRVSGSDLKESNSTVELKRLGAEVFLGHDAINVTGADEVIYSSAIGDDNPEVRQARAVGLAIKRRAEALAELMRDKTVITVTGSHGKTTTSSLISCLLLEAGLRPTIAVGGILRNIDTNACMGDGKLFVAEADESDGSFLCYYPDYSVITNIDREHLDYYRDFDFEIKAFSKFINQTKKEGCIFACGDDLVLKGLLDSYGGRRVFFGLKQDSDIFPRNISITALSSEFDCFYRGVSLGRFSLSLGGMHNISNSLAVIALGLELDLDPGLIRRALGNYQGSRRRMEIKFKSPDYLVIDDYAHHPTEIKATLAAVKELKSRRVIVAFQPHRYSRTRLLWDEFAGSFGMADYLILTDIYPASEKPLAGVDGESLGARIKQDNPGKEIRFLNKDSIVGHILNIIEPGDLVIVMGAGDIVRISDELAARLGKKTKAS
ncbi:MAG: UDP-N-acetylmuramate--L-alanine ligase [Candidatus Omnitrophota bacterium]